MNPLNIYKSKQPDLSPNIYSAIIEALSENAIFSVTDEKGNIIFANQRFIEISQYSIDEILGQNHRMLKSGAHSVEFYKDLWNTISSGKIWRGKIKNRAKDGSYYWVAATIVPILGEDGKPKNYAALRTLINEQKEFEEKSKKRLEELEKMNRFTVDRELRMVELKKEIKKLEDELVKAKGGEHFKAIEEEGGK